MLGRPLSALAAAGPRRGRGRRARRQLGGRCRSARGRRRQRGGATSRARCAGPASTACGPARGSTTRSGGPAAHGRGRPRAAQPRGEARRTAARSSSRARARGAAACRARPARAPASPDARHGPAEPQHGDARAARHARRRRAGHRAEDRRLPPGARRLRLGGGARPGAGDRGSAWPPCATRCACERRPPAPVDRRGAARRPRASSPPRAGRAGRRPALRRLGAGVGCRGRARRARPGGPSAASRSWPSRPCCWARRPARRAGRRAGRRRRSPSAGTALQARLTLLEPLRARASGQRRGPGRVLGGPAGASRCSCASPTAAAGPATSTGRVVAVDGRLAPLRAGRTQRRRGALAALDAARAARHRRGARRAGRALDGVRRRAEAGLARGLPRAQAALLAGMVLGQDDAPRRGTREDFQASGLAPPARGCGPERHAARRCWCSPLGAVLGVAAARRGCVARSPSSPSTCRSPAPARRSSGPG